MFSEKTSMYKITFSFFISFLLLSQGFISAQLPDGVRATPGYIAEIIKNYAAENSFPFALQSNYAAVKFPINVNVVKSKNGTAGLQLTDIENGLSLTNTYFKPIGIQFFIESFQFINDYNYAFVTYDNNRTEMLAKYAVAGSLNLFLVDSVKLGNIQSYGFTYFPNEPDSNYIFICKKYFTGNALATMLGHFMGLLSTHENAGGSELVSEKNCASSGDYICDTYADPDLFLKVIDNCKYVGIDKDNNGKYYVPSVSNIMSNSTDNCKCGFTPLQYRRMYYYFNKYRRNLN